MTHVPVFLKRLGTQEFDYTSMSVWATLVEHGACFRGEGPRVGEMGSECDQGTLHEIPK